MALDEKTLEKLNTPQRQAVTHGSGPLLIFAGAGSGKTRVITFRIAHLLTENVNPWNILAVTFTNKAAEEMRRRVDELTDGRGRGVWVSTFHSFCAQFLRVEASGIGLDRNFVIYDDNDQTQVIKECLRELKLDEKKFKPAQIISVISRAKDDLLDADSYAIHALTRQDPFRELAGTVYAAYQKKLVKANALDFGDLILRTVMALRDHAGLREKYQRRFKYLLVDEYQDTNHAQYLLTKYLTGPEKNICVVGDDDQCLPSFVSVSTPEGTKKIKDIQKGDEVLAGVGMGKVAPMKVNKVMTTSYRGELIRIRCRSGKTLTATPNHMCFGRLDPLPGWYYVYLMYKKRKGFRIGITSSVRSLKKNKELSKGIMVRTSQETADCAWILKTTQDASEARYYEQFFSVKYGIPTLVFHVRGRRMAIGQGHVDRLFKTIDTEESACRLMSEMKLNRRFPHHRSLSVIRGETHRQCVCFTVFGDYRSYRNRPWHDHRIQFNTSGEALRQKAEKLFPVRPGQRKTWRIETARKDYDEGVSLVRSICSLNGIEAISRARLSTGAPFLFMPASHIREGMVVPFLQKGFIKEDIVESVETVSYKGLVYDLSVPNVRNFISEDVVVHNSIYAFRGADMRNIMEFERDYQGATVVKLEQNYRSTSAILAGANNLIKRNRFRKEKQLWTNQEGGAPIWFQEFANELEEARFVAQKTAQMIQEGTVSRADMAVFYRTNAQSRVLEDAFRRENIPYVLVGSMRFYERMEVKDVISFLRLLVNPADSVGLKRVINVPPRGIGKNTVQILENEAAAKGITLYEAVVQSHRIPQLNSGARGNLQKFLDMLRPLSAQVTDASASQMVQAVLEATGYWAYWEEQVETDPQAGFRLDNLQELVNAAKEFEESAEDRSVASFLEKVSLASHTDTLIDGEGAVTLMTVHLAKGLEFPVVFLTGLEDGLFPIGESAFDKKELEEERRICYVGMTRARQNLFMTCAASRKIYGRSRYNVPSRFVSEAGVVEKTPDMAAAPGDRSLTAAQGHPDDSPPFCRTSSGSSRPAMGSFDPDEAEVRTAVRPLRIGSRVKHPMFGTGEVLDKMGSGEHMKVTVLFDSGARKTIMARYAAFELL